MKEYLIMNLERNDMHACWDASFDIQRLFDKLEQESCECKE